MTETRTAAVRTRVYRVQGGYGNFDHVYGRKAAQALAEAMGGAAYWPVSAAQARAVGMPEYHPHHITTVPAKAE